MLKSKSILIIFSILLAMNLRAQESHRVFEDTINDKSLIRITSFNHYSSNRFNNELMDKFLFGGYISQELKDANEGRLKSLNSLGGEIEQRIDSYSPDIHPFKKEKYGMVLSFSDNHFFSANISSDTYRTAMYGNANNLGDTMDLGYMHLQYQHYQKFGIGFYDKKTMSSIQVSYVSGSRAANFHTANSWLFSHTDADTVELQLRGQGFTTKSFSPYLGFQGSGFSVDLNYHFLFESKKGNRQIINLRINNLGAIFWNKNSNDYYIDSTTTYTGFDVKDFINKDTSSNTYNFVDTLGLIKSTSRYADILPLELVIEKMADRYSPNKLQLIFGFKAVLTSDYRPYLYAGIYYQPVSKFSLSTHMSYGGFAGVRWGLNLNYWPTDNLYFALGTVDMIGNISSNYGFGRSANLSAYFKI